MFKAIGQWIKKLFSSPALLKFEQFCEEVFVAEKPLVLGALRDIAIAAVQSAQSTGLDSSAKRSQALTEITAKAETIGVTASASMIALALEMAVQTLSNTQGNQGNVNAG